MRARKYLVPTSSINSMCYTVRLLFTYGANLARSPDFLLFQDICSQSKSDSSRSPENTHYVHNGEKTDCGKKTNDVVIYHSVINRNRPFPKSRRAIFTTAHWFGGRALQLQFSCSVLGEHGESSRMAVSTWVCTLSFGRCRMSKFRLLVYLDFEPI